MIILKHIDIDLDAYSIMLAYHEINLFREKIAPAMLKLIEWLAENGVEIAKAELMAFDPPAYYSGELHDSIQYHLDEGDGITYSSYATVTAGEGLYDGEGEKSYAIYVEEGTGIYGKDIHGHGVEGWWYFNVNDGHWHWTNGMRPRPFMYNTFRILEDKAQTEGGYVLAEYLAE